MYSILNPHDHTYKLHVHISALFCLFFTNILKIYWIDTGHMTFVTSCHETDINPITLLTCCETISLYSTFTVRGVTRHSADETRHEIVFTRSRRDFKKSK